MLDASVVRLIAGSGYHLVVHAADEIVVTDSETEVWARQVLPADAGQARYEIEVVQRGYSKGVDLVTADRAVVQHYLVHDFGHCWRNENGMGMLRTLVLPRGRSSHYAAVPEGSHRFGVRDVEADRWVAHELPEVSARQLVVSLPYTVDELVASYRHRQGFPVYRPVPWWRRS